MAFESVIKRARAYMSGPLKIVTGNPHLAVERAERRFGFELVRVDIDGALCVELLKKELEDPTVVAVYTQTLSYTDGITDPIPEIVQVLEAENKKRTATSTVPVTLINDSCLAFAVLVQNDGSHASGSMRALDLTENCITPTIVTLDAHKHLGTDKGVSTVVGTQGTLSNLKGHVVVGAQPTRAELVRAIADMMLVGRDEYYKKYHELSAAVERVAEAVETAGMTIVHKRNRVKGSTVIAVEDPSCKCMRLLKKNGHHLAKLTDLCRHDPSRCQTGWQVSFTPYALRQVREGASAVDVFVSDVLSAGQVLKCSKPSLLHKLIPASLLSGNPDVFVFHLLHTPGVGRWIGGLVLRRYFTAGLDSGIVRSLKRPVLKPMIDSAKQLLAAIVALVALAVVRRRFAVNKLRMPKAISS